MPSLRNARIQRQPLRQIYSDSLWRGWKNSLGLAEFRAAMISEVKHIPTEARSRYDQGKKEGTWFRVAVTWYFFAKTRVSV